MQREKLDLKWRVEGEVGKVLFQRFLGDPGRPAITGDKDKDRRALLFLQTAGVHRSNEAPASAPGGIEAECEHADGSHGAHGHGE